jgi:hypothetical protein
MEAHTLGHIRCGTTASDDGSFALEDLAAIPDFAAGAMAELGNTWNSTASFPAKSLVTPISRSISPKSNALLAWLSTDKSALRRKTVIVRPGSTNGKVQISGLNITALDGPSPFLHR